MNKDQNPPPEYDHDQALMDAYQHGYNNGYKKGQAYGEHTGHIAGYDQAISDLSNDDGWRPIETAPKDGTRVLLSEDEGRMVGAFWDIVDFDERRRCHVFWWTYDVYVDDSNFQPTYWMPSPEPPKDVR